MKINQIMTAEAHCVSSDVSLATAAGMMRDLNVGALPVCDHDRLAGMITDRDLVIRAVEEARDLAGTPVSAVMSPKIIYAFEDQDVEEVARLMEVKKIRRLPILDRSKRLVGIVSLGDMATDAGIQLSGETLKEISQPGQPLRPPRTGRKRSPAPDSSPLPTPSPTPAPSLAHLSVLRPARHLTGFALRATDGEVGHVTDLYFDNLHWQLRYFVVETGTWLKHRRVLISPVSVHAPEWDARTLPVLLTRAEIRRSPTWESNQPVSRQYETELRKHYDWPPYWGAIYGDVGIALPVGIVPPVPVEPVRQVELPGDPHLYSLKDFVGHHLAATDGEIGHVDDLLLDDESWLVHYLVVDTRNWWPGKKVLLSPWWSSEINWPERRIMMELTRESIKGSPPYDPETTLSAEQSGALHAYYGREPRPGRELAAPLPRSRHPAGP